ncbi:hypothetical protein C8J57DRAFT_1514499 [Mycena rebaudengoi]|nr:hypothetical protein C8J57DRAFT_1514499 [Mycena rebaudengoi]
MGAAHRRTARRRTRARERRHPLVLLRIHRAHALFWWVFLGHFLGCERGYAVFAVGEVWLGWGAGAGAAAAGEGARQGRIQCIFDDGLRDAVARTGVRWGCGEQDGVACAAVVCDTGGACEQLDNAVRPGHLLADAAIRNDAAIHDAGRDAALADGEDFYFYTLASSPVSSTSTSTSSTTSESCSASEESTSESESEGEEERYDAPAYTERSTDFATRHTPAAADFVQPRAHRYLSSPASAASSGRRLALVDPRTRAAPQHADHHATGSSSDTQHNSGDTRAWAVEQARRMRRLRVVPPDPSAQACRPQQQQW